MSHVAGRKTGWRDRRHLRVVAAKTPLRDLEEEEVGYDVGVEYSDDFCDSCEDPAWFAPVMHPQTVIHDGLVHVTLPRDRTTVCGLELLVVSPDLRSTDEAQAWSRANAGDIRTISCLTCVADAHYWAVCWWA